MAPEARSVLVIEEPGCTVSRDSRWLAVPSQESLKASLSFTSSAGVLGVGDADVTAVGGVVCPSSCIDRLFGGVRIKKVDTCRLWFVQLVDRVIM